MARFTIDKNMTIGEVMEKHGYIGTGKGKRRAVCLPFLLLDLGKDEFAVANPDEFSMDEIMMIYELQLRTVPKRDKAIMLSKLGFMNDKSKKEVKVLEGKAESVKGQNRYAYSMKLDKDVPQGTNLIVKNMSNGEFINMVSQGDFAVSYYLHKPKKFVPDEAAIIVATV